jgi:hypothetical protein
VLGRLCGSKDTNEPFCNPDRSSPSSDTGGREAVVEIATSAMANELRRMAIIDYEPEGMGFRHGQRATGEDQDMGLRAVYHI